MIRAARWFIHLPRDLLRLVLALVILFEEWGWEPLQRLMQRLGQLPVLRWIEILIARLPPYPALAVLLVPSLTLLPVKLGALWLVAHGLKLAGVGLIIGAKLVGTAVMARLFTLTQPALMRLAWFARLFARWTAWKAALLGWVRGSAMWKTARSLKRELLVMMARLRRLLTGS